MLEDWGSEIDVRKRTIADERRTSFRKWETGKIYGSPNTLDCLAFPYSSACPRISKLRENCEKEWETHYKCLEKHNQEYFACRKQERTFNECVFSKLVCC